MINFFSSNFKLKFWSELHISEYFSISFTQYLFAFNSILKYLLYIINSYYKLLIFHASYEYLLGNKLIRISEEVISLYLQRTQICKLLQFVDRHIVKEMIRAATFLGCRHDLDGFQNN